MKLVLSLLFLLFLLVACSPEGNTVDDLVLDEPQAECEDKGGLWIDYPNSCADTCSKARATERIVCAPIITRSCDCPEGLCWNGETCETI